MPLTNKKAIEQERRKRKYERYKVKFAAKSTIEKERAIKIKQEEQRRYRIRLKQKTGYSSKQRARLQEIKILYNQGKSTYEQQEELRKDFLKRRESRLKMEANKKAQGYKRTKDGWVKYSLIKNLKNGKKFLCLVFIFQHYTALVA